MAQQHHDPAGELTAAARPRPLPLRGGRKLAVLSLPWLFLLLFLTLYTQIVLPHALAGNVLAGCFAVFGALVFISFSLAAVSFSQDVLHGRYP